MFGHVHVHTEYSTLDGMCKIRELLQKAKDMGHSFIAITDHGSTSGLWYAQKLGDEIGIKILLGTEFYYERENDGKNGHLIAIAKNDKGLENLFRLQEFAFVSNFYKKPRINFDILAKYKEGLIISSACLASTFSQFIMEGELQQAKEWARFFQLEFGDDFYLEVQANSIPIQAIVNKETQRIADALGIKVIATNDVHYVLKEDHYAHEVLLALQINKKMSDPKRFKFDTQDFWLKSDDEMLRSIYGLTLDEAYQALSSTQLVADKCSARLCKGNHLPEYYDIPIGKTAREILVGNVIDGAKRENLHKDKSFMGEVQHEINVIDRNGYSGYFLIVADFVDTARKRGNIVGDGRGSGAGCKVAWLTGIHKIPPQKYDLLFERFLADGREPDFDVDFSDQDAVFADLASKYGEENVARIIAFGTLTPRAVCRKILSCFEHPISLISIISKLIPDLCPTLAEAIKASPGLLVYVKQYPVEFGIIERLEGIVSHESQHAGGVIICKDLSSHLPVKTVGEDRTKRIVAFDKYMVDELGHFKFDILGLETLPIIKRCLDSIEATTGKAINLHTIDMEDQNVYDMLCKGDVSGVFQLANQASKIIEQQPRSFRDLIAINALIRPGTGDWKEYIERRKGKKWSVHPDRLEYMKETEGLITYQEQFLLDAKTLAGWEIAYADKHLRKNKNIRNDHELHGLFTSNAQARGYNLDEVELVWNEIEDSVDGGYTFNKSHSASYAVISFQTSYLKYYYPDHFYASMMSSCKTDGSGQAEVSGYVAECKQRGIVICPPDINRSGENFTVTSEGINYRITTIRHVGDSAIRSILKLRPITSFEDFMLRREKRHIKGNVVVSMVKAGCFDEINPNRAELLQVFDMSKRTKTQIKEEYLCEDYEWSDKVKAEWEKESLGMYLSIHPMERYGFKPLSSFGEGKDALQGGEIYDIGVFNDKKGNEMAFVHISTLFGNVKCLVFSSTWARSKVREVLQVDKLILVKGRRSGDAIILNEIELL